jgi:hypothetical protein
MTELKLESWRLERFKPYKNNPRKNDRVVGRMVGAIREFGFRIPVIARSDGEVVDGHLRLKAAQEMRLTEVPVLLADDLSEAQIKAFRLLVNRSVSWADWDDDLLKIEMKELKLLNYDLKLTGFNDKELDNLLKLGKVEEDEYKEREVEPRTRPGDLWKLGGHRVLCGDSGLATDVERVLGGERVNVCVTEPKEKGWESFLGLYSGDVLYLWCLEDRLLKDYMKTVISNGFGIREIIVRDRGEIEEGKGHYQNRHESCVYGVREGKSPSWRGGTKESTLWRIGGEDPTERMRRAIENHTVAGDGVYEPFLGRGSSLMACENLGRRCFGIEGEARVVDGVVRRWEEWTGLRGELA